MLILLRVASQKLGAKALGVDYGTVHVGVGVSAGWSPRPLLTIKHSVPVRARAWLAWLAWHGFTFSALVRAQINSHAIMCPRLYRGMIPR